MTWGARYWPTFLVLFAVAFGVAEIFALVTKPQNTLSYWVWTTLQTQRDVRPWDWNATQFLTLGLWVVLVTWLTFHFWFHRFT